MLCSGKVYYDLLAERRANAINDVAILRLEQIYPFPEETLGRVLAPYTMPTSCGARRSRRTWAPGISSTGGWRRCCAGWTAGKRPSYVGRDAAASPATGSARAHAASRRAGGDALGMVMDVPSWPGVMTPVMAGLDR